MAIVKEMSRQESRSSAGNCHADEPAGITQLSLNPSHVKMIRKEPSGMVVAELNEMGLEPIPISRKYQDEVTKLL